MFVAPSTVEPQPTTTTTTTVAGAHPTAAMLPLPDSPDHKPIHAERFKTKMCQNMERVGKCPYESRCMFAHTAAELRTKDMNIRDNLISEEAIRAFQKAATRRRKKAAKVARKRAAAAKAKALLDGTTSLMPPFHNTTADYDSASATGSDDDDDYDDMNHGISMMNASQSTPQPITHHASFATNTTIDRLVEVLPLTDIVKPRGYRHDPYSTSCVFAASTRSYSVCSTTMPLPPPMPITPQDSPLSTLRPESVASSAVQTAQVTPAKSGRGQAPSPLMLPAVAPSFGAVLTTYGRTSTIAAAAATGYTVSTPTTVPHTPSPLLAPGTPDQHPRFDSSRFCVGPMGCLLVKCRPLGVAQQILLP